MGSRTQANQARSPRDPPNDIGARRQGFLHHMPDIAGLIHHNIENGDFETGSAAGNGFEDSGVAGCKLGCIERHLPARLGSGARFKPYVGHDRGKLRWGAQFAVPSSNACISRLLPTMNGVR